ncbi:MAG: HNH endonuclease [Bifidobacteriaceae bacterium]|jgi:hypothetical protein|nr:HNH endonuclease [Bifidobacteriaceae bacterium]
MNPDNPRQEIRALLRQAAEQTRLARIAEARAARSLAQAARVADQSGLAGWAVVEEHALSNAMTRAEARQLAAAGESGLDHPAFLAAQERGQLTTRACAAIRTAAGRSQNPEVRSQVASFGLALAKSFPAGKVRAGAEKLAALLDPAAFANGHEQQAAKRGVRLIPRPYGMAELRAYGPAHDLAAVVAGVEAAARKTQAFCRQAGVTCDARQAGFDAFCAIWKPCDDPADRAKSVNQVMARPHLLIHVNATALLGAIDTPALLGGQTPIPAGIARQIAEDATWQALVEDAGRIIGLGDRVHPPGTIPRPGDWPANTLADNTYQAGPKLRALLEARDQGCCVPNCSAPPGRCETDHRVPFDPARPANTQTTGANTQLLCKAHHQLKTHHGWRHQHDPNTGQATITTPHT